MPITVSALRRLTAELIRLNVPDVTIVSAPRLDVSPLTLEPSLTGGRWFCNCSSSDYDTLSAFSSAGGMLTQLSGNRDDDDVCDITGPTTLADP